MGGSPLTGLKKRGLIMATRRTVTTKPVYKVEEIFCLDDTYEGESDFFEGVNARESLREHLNDRELNNYHCENLTVTKITYDPAKGLTTTEIGIELKGVKFSDEQ